MQWSQFCLKNYIYVCEFIIIKFNKWSDGTRDDFLILLLCFFVFLAALHGLQDLSSHARDQTCLL